MDTNDTDWWRRSDDLEEMINDLRDRIVEAKHERVHNGPADLEPAVFYMPRETRHHPTVSHLMVICGEEEWEDGVAMAMAIAINQARSEAGEPLMCGFYAETWIAPKGSTSKLRPSQDPEASEAILMAIYHRDEAAVKRRMLIMRFHYADGGVVFDPITVEEADYTDNDNPFVQTFNIGGN